MNPLPSPLPVMQAPIGSAAVVGLAAAVCEAGGLGCLAGSWKDPHVLRGEIRALRAATRRPFCINLVLAFEQAERLEVCVQERIPVVSFSWGADAGLVLGAHEAGALVLVQVGSQAEAEAAEAAGADVLIAQGVEAGGHVQGTTPLCDLLAAVAGACPLPLVAAGGIAGRAAVASAIAAGAGAVAAGTRFLLAAEAAVHPAYAAALLGAGAADTVLTGLFDGGWPDAPHRVLRNSTYRRWQAAGEPPPGRRPGEGEQIAREGDRRLLRYGDDMPNRSVEGAAEALALYAGEGVGDCRSLEPAGAIVRDLAAGAT